MSVMPAQQSEAYKNFINSVDSEQTKRYYRFAISYFMKFCKVETYDQMLTIETKKLEGIIRDYIIHMKVDRKLSSNTINAYTAAISHFYQMNDLILNWRKLGKFKGKKRMRVEDRPYSKEEIRQLLEFASLRMKCIILLMSSCGLRRGAIPGLKFGDLVRVEKYNIYKITVYKGEKEEYKTYTTPECKRALDSYFEWRQRQGEIFHSKSPVIRREFTSINATKPKPITTDLIAWAMSQTLDKSGVKPRTKSMYQRSPVMSTHGLRKYFETTVKNNGMDTLILKRLMGQQTGLEDAYYRPSDNQILEGNDKMIGYVGVITDLTIQPDKEENEKLKQKVEYLTVKQDEFSEMKKQLQTYKAQADEAIELGRKFEPYFEAEEKKLEILYELVAKRPNLSGKDIKREYISRIKQVYNEKGISY